jgi:hypothetical protein
MHLHRHLLWVVVPAVLLPLTGCDDSKNPLSDPQTSKPDERLVGVWLERTDEGQTYWHVGHAGKESPSSVMRVVAVKHTKENVESSEEHMLFPTVLKDKTYLNVVNDEESVQPLNKEGWKPDLVECYTFLKYQLDGDNLVVWLIDEDAKDTAIKGRKVQGKMRQRFSRFTDTTENLARFVAEAGDGLWNTKKPLRLERIEAGKKR